MNNGGLLSVPCTGDGRIACPVPGDAAKLYGEASQAQPLRGDLAMQAAVWHDRAGERAAALVYAKRAAEAGEEHAAELVAKLEKAGGSSKKKR